LHLEVGRGSRRASFSAPTGSSTWTGGNSSGPPSSPLCCRWTRPGTDSMKLRLGPKFFFW
jgi:hypothetical protein